MRTVLTADVAMAADAPQARADTITAWPFFVSLLKLVRQQARGLHLLTVRPLTK
jgi:hypothetical protein